MCFSAKTTPIEAAIEDAIEANSWITPCSVNKVTAYTNMHHVTTAISAIQMYLISILSDQITARIEAIVFDISMAHAAPGAP
jgi:hypothetical protein